MPTRRRGAGAPLPRNWGRIRQAVLARDRQRCAICGGYATEVDHIIPASQGGTDHPSNLQALCRRDHLAKSGREGWQARFGREPKQREREPHPGGWAIGDALDDK